MARIGAIGYELQILYQCTVIFCGPFFRLLVWIFVAGDWVRVVQAAAAWRSIVVNKPNLLTDIS